MTRNMAKWAGWMAAALLMLGAAFHTTGLGLAKAGAQEVSNLFLAAALEPIWAMASLNWVSFSLLAAIFAGRTDRTSRLALSIIGGCLVLIAATMARSLLGFPGTWVLGLSGLLLLLSAALATTRTASAGNGASR